MGRPKIIPRRMKPTRAQKLRQFIAFVPLSLLILERLWIPFHGTMSEYLNVESIGVTKTIKALPTTNLKSSSSIPPPYPLERVTMSYRIVDSTCPRGTTRITNVVNVPHYETLSSKYTTVSPTTISKIFHQQAKTRCVTPDIYQLHERWHQAFFDKQQQEHQQEHGDNGQDDVGWSIYFHNDEAMTRLLGMEEFIQEFPHLRLVLRNCVYDQRTKSLLWRYLVLYIYGGIYADLDTVPGGRFRSDFIRDSDDAIVLLDQYDRASGQEQQQQLSIGFIAASPRHPMVYYALQYALSGLMATEDISMGSDIVSSTLHRAFLEFRKDNDMNLTTVPVQQQNPDLKRYQYYMGTNNRTVTVVKNDSNNPKSSSATPYVITNALDSTAIKRDFKKMGMTPSKKSGQRSPQSCRMKILMDISSKSSTA
jgi:hypothetical protein